MRKKVKSGTFAKKLTMKDKKELQKQFPKIKEGK